MLHRVEGFTLVELVTVMVILGILSIGTVRFITDSAQGFASTVSRAQLATDSRSTIERLVRNVRDALPNSVRVSAACVEYIPVLGASRYLTLPLATPAVTFQSVPVDPLPVPAGARVAVFPAGNIYNLASPGVVSPTASVSAPDVNNEVTVSLASPHRFSSASPGDRYFLIADPVSFCVDNGQLFRYSGYGFTTVQQLPATLPATVPGRAMVAQSLTAPVPFSVADATLTRNAVVVVDLTFTRGGDSIRFQHSVQVRNVP